MDPQICGFPRHWGFPFTCCNCVFASALAIRCIELHMILPSKGNPPRKQIANAPAVDCRVLVPGVVQVFVPHRGTYWHFASLTSLLYTLCPPYLRAL